MKIHKFFSIMLYNIFSLLFLFFIIVIIHLNIFVSDNRFSFKMMYEVVFGLWFSVGYYSPVMHKGFR